MARARRLELPPSGENLPVPRALALLEKGELELLGQVTWSSNYTFLVRLSDVEGETLGIYKPARGERPLWDFETGSLCKREVAAYRVSACLGWPNVPPTVLRDGPHGEGAVQLFVDAVEEQHFFTLRSRHRDEMKRIALFDAVINNTDRKGGHVLLGKDGRVWAIDHGVCFHEDPKLRTVIWDYIRQPIPEPMLRDLRLFRERLRERNGVARELEPYLTRGEVSAMRDRLEQLVESGVFPEPPEDWPHIPWPPV